MRRVVLLFVVVVIVLLVGSVQADMARLSFEHRDGRKLDNQYPLQSSAQEDALVTVSRFYTEGVRLACFGFPGETAIAIAIYYFDIPAEAQSVKIRIPYIAEEQGNGNGGSVWIKRAGGGEEATEQLYGDTFILKDNRYLEAINVSVVEYRQDDGRLELHLVAEGSQCVDVRYIEVETYDYPAGERVIKRESPSPTAVESAESSGSGGTERVVERYFYYSPPSTTRYVEYPWWYPYSPYWSYYTGPVWQWEWLDGCWVRVCYSYPYPRYEYYRPIVRVYWDNYWHRHPDCYVTWVDVYRVRHRHQPELLAWDEDCEQTRRAYRSAVAHHNTGEVRDRDRDTAGEKNAHQISPKEEEARYSGNDVTGLKTRSKSSYRQKGMGYTDGVWGSKQDRTEDKSTALGAPSQDSNSSGGSFTQFKKKSQAMMESRDDTQSRRTPSDSSKSSGAPANIGSAISQWATTDGSPKPKKIRREVDRSDQTYRTDQSNRSEPEPRRAPVLNESRPTTVEVKQRPEVRTEVRSEPRNVPQVKQRTVERTWSSPDRVKDDDEKEKKQQSTSRKERR